MSSRPTCGSSRQRLLIVGFMLVGGTMPMGAQPTADSTNELEARLVAPRVQALRIVLTVHSGSEDASRTGVLDAAIRRVLQSDTALPVEYYAEYLESDIFPATASAALSDYIRQKFALRRIDVVIADAMPALRFVLQSRKGIFAGIPVVFASGPWPDVVPIHAADGITGVMNEVALAETLELALSLHPSVRRVFVVAQAPAIPDSTDGIRSALTRFSTRVQLTYLREKSVPRLLDAIRAVPPQSLILYARESSEDGSSSTEIAGLVAQAAPVPIYGTTDWYIGTGIVGGMMRRTGATGGRIGDMTLQILRGTRPENVPVASVPLVASFDWRQIQRWGIDKSRLPVVADIQFKPPTAWESHQWELLAGAVALASQILLIAGLLTQRSRRRRAEATIRAKEATLRDSHQRIRYMAGRLINAQEAARAAIARDLHDDLCQKLAYVSMGVSSLKASSTHIQHPQTQRTLSELAEAIDSVFDGIRRLSHDLHPASLRLLGLVPALKSYFIEVEKLHDVAVTFKCEGELGRIHPDVAVCFFRIAQESISNGLTHGNAGCFAVSLSRFREFVDLSVADDGSGFDLATTRQNGTGLGLVSMAERARVLGGDVDVVTAFGHGTTVRARVPADPPPSHAAATTASS